MRVQRIKLLSLIHILRQIMVKDAGKRVWMPKDEEDYVEMLKGDVVK